MLAATLFGWGSDADDTDAVIEEQMAVYESQIEACQEAMPVPAWDGNVGNWVITFQAGLAGGFCPGACPGGSPASPVRACIGVRSCAMSCLEILATLAATPSPLQKATAGWSR